MEAPEDEFDVGLAIRARMTRHVVRPGNIDVRTGFALKKAGMLTAELPNQLPLDVLEVLENSKHERRISHESDPLLVYRTQESKREAIELHAVLLNPNREVRCAVLDEIERKLQSSGRFCSDIVASKISKLAVSARSEDPGEYLGACLRIHDAMSIDLRYNVELFDQACRDGVIDSVLDYFERILRPVQHGLDCLHKLPLIRYLNGNLDLSELFEGITNAPDLREMLDGYAGALGYVPLTGQYACDAALRSWRDVHPSAEVCWANLVEWADRAAGILPKYLIAQAIVGNQDIVTDECQSDISARISALIKPSRQDDSIEPSALKQKIASYFCQYLTCEFPDGDTERMAICAWWLAENVTTAILKGDAKLRKLCLDRLDEVSAATEELWMLVQPSGQPSTLFSASIQHRHLWRESLTAEIVTRAVTEGMAVLSPETLFSMTSSALGGALLGHVGPHTPGRLSYSFCLDVLPFVTQARDVLADTDVAPQFNRSIALTEKIRSPEGLVESIVNLPEADDDVARVVSFMLQQYAFANDGPRDHAWQCLSDADWRRRLVRSNSGEGCRRFFEACIRYQVNADSDKWKFELPHLFALGATEDAPDDDERLAALVGYCVVASIAGGCTSAILRLSHAKNKARLTPLLVEWHKRINNIIRFARPLASSRLRPVKQALSRAIAQRH
jgi:hypothetical protein